MYMFNKHSVAGRVAVGKTVGLTVGLLAVLLMPIIPVETALEFKIGFVLLMVMMGAMIGLVGVFTAHPIIPSFKMRWWTRGPLIGAFFFLILVLLAKDELEPFMSLDIVAWTGLTSPYWAILDGIFLGGLIGYIATKISGEGDLPLQ